MSFKSITFALIVINLLVFVAEPKVGLNMDTTDPINREFGFIPSVAFEKPWTFVTATFMHADVNHILFNMFALFIFGMVMESKLRPMTFIMFYILAGILGNFVQMGMAFTVPWMNPDVIGIGASGAVMGVLGFLGIVTPRIPIFIMFIPVPVPMYIGVIMFAIFNVALSFIPGSGIGTGAHLGGLAAGLLFGWYLKHRYDRIYRNPVTISYSY